MHDTVNLWIFINPWILKQDQDDTTLIKRHFREQVEKFLQNILRFFYKK